MKNKKAEDIVIGVIIFIILNLIFFAAMMLFVVKSGSGANVIERAKARQIALVIDEMRENTEIEINLSDLYDEAEDNKFIGYVVVPNFEDNKITVQVIEGKGNDYYFFRALKQDSIILDEKEQVLRISTR